MKSKSITKSGTFVSRSMLTIKDKAAKRACQPTQKKIGQ